MIIKNIKKRFTKWYIKKGYTFDYIDYAISRSDLIGGDDIFPPLPQSIPKAIFICPWYIRPLLVFFSPSVYVNETLGNIIVSCVIKGMIKGMKEMEEIYDHQK